MTKENGTSRKLPLLQQPLIIVNMVTAKF